MKINDKLIKTFKYIFFAFLVYAFALVFILFVMQHPLDISVSDDTIDFSEGWKDLSGNSVKLTNAGYFDTIQNTIPDIDHNVILYMNVINTNVSIRINENEVFNTDAGYTYIEGRTPGSYYVRLPLSSDDAGSLITISLDSPYGDDFGRITSIQLGDAWTLSTSYLANHLTGFVICVFCVFFGLIIVLIYIPLSISGIKKAEILYLGIFSFNIGLFMMNDTGFLQILFGHAQYFHTVAELWMMFIAFPLFMFLEELYGNIGRRSLVIICSVCTLEFLIRNILNLTGLMDLHQTVIMTHGVYVLSVIVLIISIFQTISKGIKGMKFHFAGVISICAGAILDILIFQFGYSTDTTTFSRIGVLLFLCFEASQIVMNMLHWYREYNKQQFIHELAYNDGLTGLLNRTSYEEMLDEYREGKNTPAGVEFFDIIGLKYVNENYGHATGDALLTQVSRCINEVYGKFGDCYRIGGNEFVLLTDLDWTETEVSQYEHELEVCLKECRIKELPDFELKVACGYCGHMEQDISDVDSMINTADKRMYRNKMRMKTF